jgi:hypothetical protein
MSLCLSYISRLSEISFYDREREMMYIKEGMIHAAHVSRW